jgi:hypothetical protein
MERDSTEATGAAAAIGAAADVTGTRHSFAGGAKPADLAPLCSARLIRRVMRIAEGRALDSSSGAR